MVWQERNDDMEAGLNSARLIKWVQRLARQLQRQSLGHLIELFNCRRCQLHALVGKGAIMRQVGPMLRLA